MASSGSSPYQARPWLALYADGQPADVDVQHATGLAMWQDTVSRSPDRVLVRYFDGSLTVRELDEQSDALAAALQDDGFSAGDRLAVYLQNVPQWLVALIASWKAGGMAVAVNPMNRARELTYLLQDSGAVVLICHENLYDDVARDVLPDTKVRTVLTTSELDYQDRADPRLFAAVTRARHEGTRDLLGEVEAAGIFVRKGRFPCVRRL